MIRKEIMLLLIFLRMRPHLHKKLHTMDGMAAPIYMGFYMKLKLLFIRKTGV